jgi:hypothetical protein
VVNAGTARRPGHSLPELIVAIAFLGTTLGVVGSTAVLGARQVAGAALLHEAVREAAAALDSLAAVPAPEAGGRTTQRLRILWEPGSEAGHPRIRVTVLPRSGDGVLAMRVGAPVPAVDTLPSAAAPRGADAGSPPEP